MILLGLGSNQGDRLGHLTRALRELISRQVIRAPIRVSRVYESEALLPTGAPSSWDIDFFNAVIEADSSLKPMELLAAIRQIEADLGRERLERWEPRCIDIDILWVKGESIKTDELQIPHPGLLFRSFWLKPLAELRSEIAMNGGRVSIEQLSREMVQSAARALPITLLPTELMGIVNLTPDSFSDGGLYEEPVAAFRRIRELVEEGASLIDLGAESTRPGARLLEPKQEWLRFEPILNEVKRGLSQEYPWIKWSIDTRHSETARLAREYGIHWFNDVSGGASSQMIELWAESSQQVCFMHSLSLPADPKVHLPEDADPVQSLLIWANEKRSFFESFGIQPDRLIFDPGIGFGKTADQSVMILNRVSEFRKAGWRVLVGHSRKSFLKLVTQSDPQQRDVETEVLSTKLSENSCDYLRLHDVRSSVRAIRSALLVS
jgi:2-amino-4-hydroxy-6-hydroxymethyldihydropteridine diphosphokinase/dihydropteroate synthase